MDAEIKKKRRLIKVLMDEKQSFWGYYKLAKHEVDHATKSIYIAMMDDKIEHYSKMFKMLFPSNVKVVDSSIEHLFKDMLIDEHSCMKAMSVRIKE